ncbi:MAG: response regulator [Candidatus Eisenbacteria bacterium]|nr:response regulator [Candidatus Eisenbacteria bacterium]
MRVKVRKKNILVADDEKHSRLGLSLVLRKAGYEVTIVSDGVEALARIVESAKHSKSFDLLVVDVQMPGLTGSELVEELLRINAVIPVLVMSGYRDKDTVAGLSRNGCLCYAEKPFSPSELLDHVARAFNEFKRRKNLPEGKGDSIGDKGSAPSALGVIKNCTIVSPSSQKTRAAKGGTDGKSGERGRF